MSCGPASGTGNRRIPIIFWHVTRDDVVRQLRPVLDLPVEIVLPAHGQPTDRTALERVLR